MCRNAKLFWCAGFLVRVFPDPFRELMAALALLNRRHEDEGETVVIPEDIEGITSNLNRLQHPKKHRTKPLMTFAFSGTKYAL